MPDDFIGEIISIEERARSLVEKARQRAREIIHKADEEAKRGAKESLEELASRTNVLERKAEEEFEKEKEEEEI